MLSVVVACFVKALYLIWVTGRGFGGVWGGGSWGGGGRQGAVEWDRTGISVVKVGPRAPAYAWPPAGWLAARRLARGRSARRCGGCVSSEFGFVLRIKMRESGNAAEVTRGRTGKEMAESEAKLRFVGRTPRWEAIRIAMIAMTTNFNSSGTLMAETSRSADFSGVVAPTRQNSQVSIDLCDLNTLRRYNPVTYVLR